MKQLERSREQGCLSDLTIDRLVCGELSDDAAEGARTHVATCAVCRERLDAIVDDRREFAAKQGAQIPALSRPANGAAQSRVQGKGEGHSGASRARWIVRSSAILALAAALLLWFRARSPREEEDGTRLKGAGRLSFFVARDGEGHRGSSGEVLRSGDRVQFVVALVEARYVAVLSRDGRGRASIFFPEARAAERVESGPSVRLGTSTILDDAPGREDVFGLFCRAPQDLESVRAALESSGRLISPSGCETDAFHWMKEPAP